MEGLPPFVANSSLAAVLAALFSGGALATILAFVTRWRGQSIGSEERLRQDMARELEAMRAQMRELESHYRRMLEASDKRHEECEKDRTALRRELNAMHEEIKGLRSQIRAQATDRVMEMEQNPPPAPHSRAAAHRVKNIIENDDK